jgi:peptide/nickel transport system permease protein
MQNERLIPEPIIQTMKSDKKMALRTFSRMVKYALGRVAMIFATITVGVFITVVLANRGGTLDASVKKIVNYNFNQQVNIWVSTDADRARIDQMRKEFETAAGLNLPYWPRQVRWTYEALTLNLGSELEILSSLPNTMLLIGSAFLLLFLLGIPLALFLYRKQGRWIDRFITLLAPLSSVPSWVLAILLMLVFAVELRLLPVSGMYDMFPPDSKWGYIPIVLKHMILPVSAIFLSMFFQAVYTWRTFFLLYADEDYVELGKAKGLSNRDLESRYVLKPALSYILTNFALMLAGFWQVTTALEKVMNWPGLGRLYIVSLPNYLGDSFYPGEMAITVGVMVIFAYLLGLIVFLLDISYVILDPRIRIGSDRQTMHMRLVRTKQAFRAWRLRRNARIANKSLQPKQSFGQAAQTRNLLKEKPRLKEARKKPAAWKPVLLELLRYPSAVFGLSVILLLIIGSILAVTIFPYKQMGELWYTHELTGQALTPKKASPAWVNSFRKEPLPVSLILDSRDGTVSKSITTGSNGMNEVTFSFAFDYEYQTIPQSFVIYFEPQYGTKAPFVFKTWITPDGRQYDLGGGVATKYGYYDLAKDVPTRKLLAANAHWRNWYVNDGEYGETTPGFQLLFAPADAEEAAVLPGRYELKIEALTFEEGTDLDAKMVILGQVYGIAGTDYMRRDLLVPLLWGMPFALAFGLLGAMVTTVLSMMLAAVSAWYGGWLDNIIQRLIEANMILPIIAVGILLYAYFDVSLWTLLTIVVLLNAFGSPTKSFRAALLQVKESPYIEAARSYGASDSRIILRYLVPRILPVLIPQLVTLIPSYVFLEATLGIFNVKSDYPTWGKVIYEALRYGGITSSRFWVLEPIGLLLLTGLAFAMLGFALERILNPRLKIR